MVSNYNMRYQNLVRLTQQKRPRPPVFITGPVGSGKTSFVHNLVSKTSQKLTTIQISSDTDAKSLLGSYICGNKPGQFIYQNGSITSAAKSGNILFIEDIDQSPADVYSLILYIVDHNIINLPNSVVQPHPDFFLVLSSRLPIENRLNSRLATRSLVLRFQDFTDSDLEEISVKKFKKLQTYLTNLISLYRFSIQETTKLSQHNHLLKIPSTRDFLKLCHRVNSLQSISSENLLLEIFDVFFCSAPDLEIFKSSLLSIANQLNLPSFHLPTPEISISDQFYITKIGRTNLKLDMRQNKHFATTTIAMKKLEQISVCVNHCEPVLLTGETGVGKTTSLQYLANKKNLVVLNMSQASEGMDLIGSYKPIEQTKLIKKCLELFLKTFDDKQLENNQVFLKHVNSIFQNCQYMKLVTLIEQASIKRKLDRTVHFELFDAVMTLKRTISSEDQEKMSFQWVNGALTKAVLSGSWVLLDEINLAPVDLHDKNYKFFKI